MLKSVLAAPVAYFDSTPLGRIINCLSTDITASDTEVVAGLQFLDTPKALLANADGLLTSIAQRQRALDR